MVLTKRLFRYFHAGEWFFGRCLCVGFLGTKECNALGNDVSAVLFRAVLLVFAVLDAAFDTDLRTLLKILLTKFGGPVPCCNVVPLRQFLSLRPTTRSQRKVTHSCFTTKTTRNGARLWVFTQIANKKHPINARHKNTLFDEGLSVSVCHTAVKA